MGLEILLAVDQHGWCFHHISNQLISKLSVGYGYKVVPHVRVAREKADIVVNFWWGSCNRMKANVRAKGHVLCVYDGLSWRINEDAKRKFLLACKVVDLIAVCNQRFMKELKQTFGDALPPMVLIEDGVDTELFKVLPFSNEPTSFGWTGNSQRMTPGGPEDQKGVAMLREAKALSGVPVKLLDAATGGKWPHEKMPEFYGAITVMCCLGYVEGTPNPLLEAMACGRPVLCTRSPLSPKGPGLAEQLIQHGVNGWIVDRNPEALATAMKDIAALPKSMLHKMGLAARKSVMPYDWSHKVLPWRTVFEQSLRLGATRDLRSPSQTPPAVVENLPARFIPTKEGIQQALAAVQSLSAEAETAAEQPTHIEMKYPQPELRSTLRPRVLLISDVRDWAFHTNMMDLEQTLSDRFEFEHWFVAEFQKNGEVPDFGSFHAVFNVYHRWGIDAILPWDRLLGSLRSSWFSPETPAPAGQKEYDLVNRYKAFHVVTKPVYDELKNHCPNVMYLTNPVNMARFPFAVDLPKTVIASWNGNARHSSGRGDVKGFHSFIKPAIAALDIPFNYAEYNSCRLAPNEMPGFYQKSNVAICMSEYEGASNSTAEAMASGHALVTTDVGHHREMQEHQLREYKETGIRIINRDVKSLCAALAQLRSDPSKVRAMGQLNRAEIQTRWSWHVWAERYAEFLNKAINSKPPQRG